MRALLFLIALLGVVVVSEVAEGQEKKEKYTEQYTVRVWDGSKFLNPQMISVRPGDVAGVIYTNPAQAAGNTTPIKGSELTDKDGAVWVADKCDRKGSTNEYKVTLKKKP